MNTIIKNNTNKSRIRLLIYSFITLFWAAVLVGILFLFSIIPQLKQDRVLNILSWGNIFDQKTLTEFEKNTGIKVHITYYMSNEELLVSLKASKGKGYDIVVPSDYAVLLLRTEFLLKKIDHTKLNFLTQINPRLMGHKFDKQNEYSLPYMWEVFGIGYDKRVFPQGIDDNYWEHIFEPTYLHKNMLKPLKITMLDDPIEAVNLAVYYLEHKHGIIIDEHNWHEHKERISELLIQQRKWIKAYTDFRPDYFILTENSPLVITESSSFMRGLDYGNYLGFMMPGKKPYVSIENIAIACSSKKDTAIYKFLNYIYKPEIVKRHFEEFSSLPATTDVLSTITIIPELKNLFDMPVEKFRSSVRFFKPLIPESILQSMWVDIKSRS